MTFCQQCVDNARRLAWYQLRVEELEAAIPQPKMTGYCDCGVGSELDPVGPLCGQCKAGRAK